MGFPAWLRKDLPSSSVLPTVAILNERRVHTVCESARCPNRSGCFSKRCAAFLILGPVCTRHCRFCTISHGEPHPVDPDEPRQVAEAVYDLGCTHAVITSVTRDDLEDGGASQFVAVVEELNKNHFPVTVEVLTPDFGGCWELVQSVCEAGPSVYNHNVETVRRLYPTVRPQAVYERSLQLLGDVKYHFPHILTKSGLMLGLGETEEEVLDCLKDLRRANCDILIIGQYLRPHHEALEVKRFYPPKVFDFLRKYATKLGFLTVVSEPFARSSYQAGEVLQASQGSTRSMSKVIVPPLPPETEEAMVNCWYVEEGDHVEMGEDLAEVVADDTSFVVIAPCSGTLTEVFVEEGESVSSGEILAEVEED